MLECGKVHVTPIFSPMYVAEPPRITTHPQDLKDAVPGKHVLFTIKATGTEPLNYQWEWKSTMDDDEWQSCKVETFSGAESSTLTIPSVQKSNEGNYRCVISNCAGSQASHPAKLCLSKNLTKLFYYSFCKY